MRQAVDYRSLYFDATLSAQLPQQPAIIGVGPLLQALLEPIAQAPFDHDWRSPRAHHQLALCVLEIAAAPVAPMDLLCHAIRGSRAACRWPSSCRPNWVSWPRVRA
jgi:hypothetical protein